jgi:hypothetical protein
VKKFFCAQNTVCTGVNDDLARQFVKNVHNLLDLRIDMSDDMSVANEATTKQAFHSPTSVAENRSLDARLPRTTFLVLSLFL